MTARVSVRTDTAFDAAGGLPRSLLAACVFFSFAATVNTQTFGLLLVRVADSTGLSVAAMGGLRTLENVASIAVALLLAPIVDRYPRRWPLAAGLALGAIAALIIWAMPTPLGVAIYLLCNGSAVMLAISTAFAIPPDFVTGRGLSRATGFMIAGFALSEIIFLPVAGRVADQFGWRAAFLVTSAVITAGLMVALALAPGQRPHADVRAIGPRSRYRAFFANRQLLLMLASALIRFAQFGAITVFLSAILVGRFGLSLSVVGLVFSIAGAAAFSGSALSGFLLHQHHVRQTLVEGGLVIGSMLLLALVFTLPVLPTVGLIVATMFGLALQENASTLTVLELSPDARGAAMSLNELSAAAGALTGIGLGSIGFDVAGPRGLGAVLVGLALMGAAGSWRVLRRQRDRLPVPLSDHST